MSALPEEITTPAQETQDFLARKHQLLIGGQWVDPVDGATSETEDPATENVIAGVVVSFSNIDTYKELEKARDYSVSIINSVREPLVVLDESFHVFSANRAYLKTFVTTDRQVQGESLFDLGNRQWDVPELKKLLEEVLTQDKAFESFEITHEFPKLGRKTVRLNARRLMQDPKLPTLILLAFSEVLE